MTIDRRSHPMAPVPAPTKHELAFMIWLAVFATLTVLNLLFEPGYGRYPPCREHSYWRRSQSPSSSTGSCRSCTAPADGYSAAVPKPGSTAHLDR
jgi:hypothetical protein